MLKKILSYGGLEAVAKGLNRSLFLILPLFLPISIYGKVGIIAAAELLLPMLSMLGFDRAILRFYHEKENYSLFTSSIFCAITLAQLFLFLVFGVLVLFFDINLIFGLDAFPDLFLLLIDVYLLNLIQVFLNIQRVEENHKSYFSIRLLFQIVKFVFVIVFFLFFKDEISYLLGVFSACLIVILMNFKRIVAKFNFKFSKTTLKFMILFCWPFVFHSIASNLLGTVDRFILESYVSLNEIGVYTFVYSIASSLSFAYQGVSVYLEPRIYNSSTKKQQENRLSYYLYFTIFAGSIAFVFLVIASIWLIPLYFPEYESGINMIPIIGFGQLFMPFYFYSNYRLMVNKKPFSIAKVSVLSAIVNIILLFVLIPIYGVYAAAISVFISLFFLGFFILLLSNSFKITSGFNFIIILAVLFSLLIFLSINSLYFIGVFCVASYSLFKLLKLNSLVADGID